MKDPEHILSDSPADFNSSFAYALHGEMRRLLIITLVGAFVFPAGLSLFLDPTSIAGIEEEVVIRLIGLVVGIIGAAFLYGGLVGTLFKIITDANIVAAEQ